MAVAARTGAGFKTGPLALLADERLARMAAAGHERAFAVVYERHQQPLYRYCRSILRNDADAQDALQSTFTAAFAALGRGRPDAPIRPWLFRIAHNEAVSVLRRRRPTAELSAATDYGTTSVEEQVAERAELDLLLRDLRELHERQRSALVMRELSGLSHDEIALALQTSVGAAKQAIYEARRSLFEFAEGRAMPCDEIQRTISDADGRLLRSRRVRAHLRECSACAAFAAAIPARRQELRALVPTLPAVTAAGLLERISGGGTGAGAGHGAGTGLGGLVTGAAGKASGAALTANALAGVAVVATATVGVTVGVDRLVHPSARAHNRSSAGPVVRHESTSARTPSHTVLLPAISAHRAHRGPISSGASPAHRATGTSKHAASFTTSTAAGSRPGTTPGRGNHYGAVKTPAGHGPPPWARSGSGPGSNSARASSSTAHGAGAAKTNSGHGPPPWAGSGSGKKSSTAGASSSSAQRAGTTKTSSGHGPPPRAGANRKAGVTVSSGATAVPTVTTPNAVPSAPRSDPPSAAVSAAHKPGK